MENITVILIVALIVAAIVFYLIKQKKKGSACIGCPHCKACSSGCSKKGK